MVRLDPVALESGPLGCTSNERLLGVGVQCMVQAGKLAGATKKRQSRVQSFVVQDELRIGSNGKLCRCAEHEWLLWVFLESNLRFEDVQFEGVQRFQSKSHTSNPHSPSHTRDRCTIDANVLKIEWKRIISLQKETKIIVRRAERVNLIFSHNSS
jgi:hypothetical protein